MSEDQVTTIRDGYAFDAQAITLGVLKNDEPVPDAPVRFPLSTMNRHGLVAGATGTGKTRTLQLMTEALSDAGVPVFAADMKGDLTGMVTGGEDTEKIRERTRAQGQDWEPSGYPCEFFALGGRGIGVPIRATVSGFGPLLLSKVLGLNQVQESSLGLVFYYADQHSLPLLDLKDLIELLKFLNSDDGKADLKDIGGVSSATIGVILRNLVTLSQQGGDVFFGEPEFDPADLMRCTADGRGIISLLQLPDVASQPALFSTFLMWLLADLFNTLPEVGDLDKPKLVFFFDEAHLLFRDASKAFLESIVQTVRLIRSKGVGVFFVTQTPKDVPGDVLAQLGSKVQHQIRVHTPTDAKALKDSVATFPISDYDLAEVLQQLGTGEALVTVLDPKGSPTPVAWTRLWAPRSLMAAYPGDLVSGVARSQLMGKYGTAVDRESAYEILAARLAEGARAAEEEEQAKLREKQERELEKQQRAEQREFERQQREAERERRRIEKEYERDLYSRQPRRRSSPKRDDGLLDELSRNPMLRDMARTASREVTREFVRGMFRTGRKR